MIMLVLSLHVAGSIGPTDSVYFTTGFKIGGLTDSSAVFWTRLCADPEPLPAGHERKEPPMRHPLGFDEDMPVDQMDGAVRGAFGQVRISLVSGKDTISSGWEYVSGFHDHTWKRKISRLIPGTDYAVVLEGRYSQEGPVTRITGAFRTPPDPSEIRPVTFTSSSCQYFWDYDDPDRGFRIYDSMRKLEPDFHCQTGDYVYYDKPGPMATNVEKARHKWHANNAWPSVAEFYAVTPLYLQKDDHDMLKDDAFPGISPFGELTFPDGLKIWYEQVPVEGLPYGTFRWGKDLQIWVVEGREYRSDNRQPDGESKSIWGQAQREWFTETASRSDATFRILVSPTPVVGPDRDQGKYDNHANEAYSNEGTWLRKFLAENGFYVINGDRHWQYVSVDEETGLMEFSQGASSDSHAQGWSQEDFRPQHRFLRVQGGFLVVNVFREEGIPCIEFIHYDVNGREVHRERFRE